MSITQPPLSPRQRQVLTLLREGKANKEIAHQLGIGVGTVKQHVIALFRKMQASNRTMAVGLTAIGGPLTQALPQLIVRPEGVLQWRPACVLSLAVSFGEADGTPAVRGLLQSALASATRQVECTTVADTGAADVIFGLHHADEANQTIALDLAAAVRQELRRMAQAERLPLPHLRGGLASGFLLASLERRGGWTGEIIAGNLIGQARALRDGAASGLVALDADSRRMLARPSSGEDEKLPAEVPLDRPLPFRRRAPRPVELFGRDAELALIGSHLDTLAGGGGGVLVVEGEAGMGKTALVRSLGARAVERGMTWVEWRCGDPPGRLLRALERGAGRPPGEACAVLAPRIGSALELAAEHSPCVLFLDDCHLASRGEQSLLNSLAALTSGRPILLIVAARLGRAPVLPMETRRIRLARLDGSAIARIVRANALGSLAPDVFASCVALSAGVPLFAVELARGQGGGRMSLALATVVLSRLDGLAFDRRLLGLVARHGPLSSRQLAGLWAGESASLDQAVAESVRLGLLARAGEADEDVVAFAHPLVGELWRELMPVTESAQ